MAKPHSILAVSAFFDFPFGRIEVSEEILFYDTIPVNYDFFVERLRSALKRNICTALNVSFEFAILPDGVKPSGAVTGYEAALRAFVTDLCCILSNYISANYVPENKIVR